jgi:hypothetical protein
VNKQDLSKNLKFFNVPETSIHSVYSKLEMRIFEVYANILKCMYSTRFSGGPARSEASPEAQPTPIAAPPLIRSIDTPVRISIKGGEKRVMRRKINKIIRYIVYRTT